MTKKYAEMTSHIRGGMSTLNNNTNHFNLQGLADIQMF